MKKNDVPCMCRTRNCLRGWFFIAYIFIKKNAVHEKHWGKHACTRLTLSLTCDSVVTTQRKSKLSRSTEKCQWKDVFLSNWSDKQKICRFFFKFCFLNVFQLCTYVAKLSRKEKRLLIFLSSIKHAPNLTVFR